MAKKRADRQLTPTERRLVTIAVENHVPHYLSNCLNGYISTIRCDIMPMNEILSSKEIPVFIYKGGITKAICKFNASAKTCSYPSNKTKKCYLYT
ncbi:MAG: hypothetical protein LBH29_03250 [Elusimicrobiota bacterium]|nr:hypothetical protein [Elusimicrobiota bacterium]